MNKALHRTAGVAVGHGSERVETGRADWRKRMSNHVAFALLVYTALQIVCIALVMKTGHGSLLPYFGLVLLVVGVIPGCRLFESRWTELADADAADPALAPAFARDCVLLWLAALTLPLAVSGLFRLFAG